MEGKLMTYLPAANVRFEDLTAVKGLALARPLGGSDAYLLLTGDETGHAFFMSGDSKGRGYPASEFRAEYAMIIEGVEIELDLDSSFRPAYVDQPVGAMRMIEGRIGLGFLSRGDGWNDRIQHVGINGCDIKTERQTEEAIGFSRWRVVKAQGSERIVIATFEADEKASG
jgi:hypothetical protein